MERKILKAASQSREIFNQIERIEAYNNFSDQGRIIYNEFRSYYETDKDAQKIDVSIVEARLVRRFPRQETTFRNIFVLLEEEQDVSGINIVQECIALAERHIGLRLSSALLENSKDISKLLVDYTTISEKINGALLDVEDSEFFPISIEELYGENEQTRKIKLLPMPLNSRIGGGIEPGDNILVYARPEVGKSLFTINAACGFVVQGYKTLYYGNEDPAQRMLRRVVQRLTGLTKDEIIRSPSAANDRLFKRGYENFCFHKGRSNTFDEVRAVIDKIEPSVLILDQLRHMVTGNDNRVIQLEEAANASRRIASEYGIPVINVTQAGDSAENKLSLGQGDVDFSNTGIPGAMDLMIGIGANEDFLRRQMRRISLPKNKLNNDHSSFDVVVNEQLSKIVE